MSIIPKAIAYIEKFRSIAKEINTNCFQKTDTDLSNFNFPIYYLFDHTINTELGMKLTQRTFLRRTLHLDELFSLNSGVITDVAIERHATVFYQFKNGDRQYLYYSNSGLGIENQLTTNDITSCKILYLKDSTYYRFIPAYINEIIRRIQHANAGWRIYDYGSSKNRVSETYNILREDFTIMTIGLPREDYEIMIDYIIGDRSGFEEINDKNKAQTLCSILLNYIINRLNRIKNPYTENYECSFNHVLNGTDDEKYRININRLSEGSFLRDFILNCYNGKNKAIYEDIIQLKPNPPTPFNLFIDEINLKLKGIEVPSIKYKLSNSFVLFFHNITGLFNKKQQSGSCGFYSYYNLAINMLILHIFNTSKNPDEFIEKFIEFHYYMIFLLCISNDTQYKPDLFIIYDDNNIHNYLFIDRLINENNLLDEILTVYERNNTLYFNPNRMLSDYNLDIKIAGKIKLFNSDTKLNNNLIFTNLFNCLDEFIYNIRNRKLVPGHGTSILIKNTINDLFEPIIRNSIDTSGGNNLLKYLSDKESWNINYTIDIPLVFNTIKNIYTIYLILLVNIYNVEGHKNIINNKKNIVKILDICQIRDDRAEYNPYSKKDKCKKTGSLQKYFYTSTTYQDFLLCRLNINEIFSISDILEDPVFIEPYNPNNILELDFFKYIYVTETNFTEDLTNRNFLPYYYEPLNFSFNFSYILEPREDKINNFMRIIFNKYVNCKNKINNIFISEVIKDEYRKTIENIEENIIDFFIKRIDDLLSYKKGISSLIYSNAYTILFIIITDGKYIFINKQYLNIITALHYFSIITDISIINIIDNEDIYDKMVIISKILKKIRNDPLNKQSHVTELIESIFNPLDDKIKWIEELDFIPRPTLEYKYNYEYNGQTYYLSDLVRKDILRSEEVLNNIYIILSRFGFNIDDIINKYLLLFPINCTERAERRQESINITHENTFYILIHKTKKCIEICFNSEGYIDINTCFIFDKKNKTKKDQLLLNLDKKIYPFLNLIPRATPYLCYQRNNEYFLEIIISGKDKNITKNLYNNKINLEKIYDIYSFKISPSMLFIQIDSFDLEKYNILYKIFDTNHINKINRDFLSRDIIYVDFLERDGIHTIIKSIQRELIDRNVEYDDSKIRIFREILNYEIKEDESKREIYDSFINENRFCSFNCPGGCNFYSTKIIELNIIKNRILESIILNRIVNNTNNNVSDYLLNNIDKFLLLMEINVLIKLLSTIKADSNCWDIGYVLTTLKSLIYFNETIIKKFYYGFEILFLLQNDYFFKENQMSKYNEIRNDLITKESSLKLHQFMMGKGKTSVFTPLLSFAVNILTDKRPTIVTVEHLVNQTKKFMYFTEKITDLKTNVFSDFQAKKRWLEYTDVKLNSDLLIEKRKLEGKLDDKSINRLEEINNIKIENEMNIIDEFDYHHNYLQSIFNYVQKKEPINKELFDYIFEYTFCKLDAERNKMDYTGEVDKVLINPLNRQNINIEILNANLNDTYNSAKTMIYNQQYGFSFLIFEDEKNTSWRICTPFANKKDTPVKDSNFSNILLRLILTIKLYIERFEGKLQTYDYENIGKNKIIGFEILPLIENLIEANEVMLFYTKFSSNLTNRIEKLFEKIYLKIDFNKKCEILKKYLYEVNKTKINITTEQRNMSFQDIIYNNYNQWQVGYTGTASLELNNYIDNEKFVFRNILEDFDEKIEVILALNKYGVDLSSFEGGGNWCFKGSVLSPSGSVIPPSGSIIPPSGSVIPTSGSIIPPSGSVIPPSGSRFSLECDPVDSRRLDVYFLDQRLDWKVAIEEIIEVIKDNPRGFVDLAGIFINNKNEEIAKELKNHYKETKKIIYITLENKGKEYNIDNTSNDYIPEDENNFYYYDQCHTVGTDLKQPRTGHVAIIIDKNTRLTDFAQAIFRFRKLNRGTYLTVFYTGKEEEEDLYKTTEEIYTLLKNNEDKFNKDQIDGIKYQLLKTMVRKISNCYCEDQIYPEFMRSLEFDIDSTIQFMKDNINNLNGCMNNEKTICILDIFNQLKSLGRKLIELVNGSVNLIENDHEHQEDIEREEIQQRVQQIAIAEEIIESNPFLKTFYSPHKYIIKHLNCNSCIYRTCVKLFNTSDIRINNKEIYISYNFFNYKFEEFNPKLDSEIIDYEFFKNDRFCFIELNNKILIELEDVALEYYLYKLPVYDYLGHLLLPYMGNLNVKSPLKFGILDIDDQFIRLFGIKNYINPNPRINPIVPFESIISNVNQIGLILLAYIYYNRITDRYTIDPLLERYFMNIHTIPISPTIIPRRDLTHNIENTIDLIYFDEYINILRLDESGYMNPLPIIKYNKYYYFTNYDFDFTTFIGSIEGLNISVNESIDGGYYKKYLKYKKKYIALKDKI